MTKYGLNIINTLLIVGLALVFNPAYGETHRYTFYAISKMLDQHQKPVDQAYGLISIVSDDNGKGRINVMFSNGSKIDWAKFNARVKFINASGSVLKNEHIYRWLDAANEDGASERKVSKLLSVNEFTSVEVEFYLTDIPETGLVKSDRVDVVRAYFLD